LKQIISDPAVTFIIISVIIFIFGYAMGRFRRALLENRGEAAVRRELTHRFGDSNYHLLNNVTLPFEGGTTQIDHILVSRFGVFVIETKHYTGWIFGDAKSPKWTQVIYRMKYRFQNPLHQNEKHLRAVRKLLDFVPQEHIHGLVAFTGNAVFKTECPDGVFNIRHLVKYILDFKTEVMTANRMQFCVGRMECGRRLISRRTDVEHQAYLDRKFGRVD
jgi:restriction system protein